MKFTIALLAALAATGVVAVPTAEPADLAPADLETRENLESRAPCYYPSECSIFGAAKCEHYCRRDGAPGYETVEVTRMEKCNLLNQKRCCCSS